MRILLGSIFLAMLAFLACATSVAAQPPMAWPSDCVVLVPGIPVAHTDRGTKLLDAAPFIDESSRLQVPLRFLAEELGATVNYQAPLVSVIYDNVTVVLELGTTTAWVNNFQIELDTSPVILHDRVFVPLRFVADNLGYVTHYREGVILVGGWYTEPTSEQSLAWRQGISSRWVAARADWELQAITVDEPSLEMERFAFYWRYLEDDTFALYQALREQSSPQMLMLIADDIKYNNRGGYFPEDNTTVASYAFYVREDAVYAVLSVGGATMGSRNLYRIGSEDPTVILARTMYIGSCVSDSGYIYYTKSFMGFGNTYRIHLPSVLAGDEIIEEKVGQEGFSYRSFCIDREQQVMYAAGYANEEGAASDGDQRVLYRIDLNTMQHEMVISQFPYIPCGIAEDWIYYLKDKAIWRMRNDGSAQENAYPLLQNVENFYLDGGSVVYLNQWTDDWEPVWNRVDIVKN